MPASIQAKTRDWRVPETRLAARLVARHYAYFKICWRKCATRAQHEAR
ncbi:hypothetical protein KCP69_16500 [Salmonella enterica subsp. enterica]|nr:hypothetical protein KCP69_16500 [Salmonella enterica subsp. enterica]